MINRVVSNADKVSVIRRAGILEAAKELCEVVSDLHESAREIMKCICATARKFAGAASDVVVGLVARPAG